MSLAAQIVIAVLLVLAGAAGGWRAHVGVVAQQELEARVLREADARQQRAANDQAAGRHAAALAAITTQLGDARARIASLSDRPCLAADTVGLLNATGVLPGRAAAGDPAGAPAATAAGAGKRYSTERDVAGYIALCRAEYAAIAGQLNEILDREERRHPAPPD